MDPGRAAALETRRDTARHRRDRSPRTRACPAAVTAGGRAEDSDGRADAGCRRGGSPIQGGPLTLVVIDVSALVQSCLMLTLDDRLRRSVARLVEIVGPHDL